MLRARCQLCLSEDGTLPHRHACPKIVEVIGSEVTDNVTTKIRETMPTDRAALWQTRGIGAFRNTKEAKKQQEWLQWIVPNLMTLSKLVCHGTSMRLR